MCLDDECEFVRELTLFVWIVGEECPIMDLWFFALLQTILLHMNFRGDIKDFLLEVKTRSREMMTIFRDFMSDHRGKFFVSWFFKVVGENCQTI
jgi:hypothetical protein